MIGYLCSDSPTSSASSTVSGSLECNVSGKDSDNAPPMRETMPNIVKGSIYKAWNQNKQNI